MLAIARDSLPTSADLQEIRCWRKTCCKPSSCRSIGPGKRIGLRQRSQLGSTPSRVTWCETRSTKKGQEERIADVYIPAETLLQRKDIAARLQQALLSLSLEQREVILLNKYEELSFPEIAAILGCSVTAAKVRAFRALRALRVALGDRKDLC